MIGETELIYREEQRFGLWLRWLVILSMVWIVPLSIFSLAKMPSGQGSPEILPIITLIVAGIFVPIAIAVLFWLLKLETEVHPDGLYVRYFPFHIHFKRFTADDLSKFYARKYKPIREYGGWGIRCSFGKGKAYNVSGNKGVQLVFKNGKRLLIGSHRAEELEEAIRSIMGGKQNKSESVTMAERGLLEESVWKNALRGFPLGLLSSIRANLVETVPGLKEKFNRNGCYFGYWIGSEKDRVYIYIQQKNLRIDLCISRDLEEDIRRQGFNVHYVNNYQGRTGWLTGWKVPHSTNKIEAVMKWLHKAFEGNL
ncbi:MAG TPA: DUF6141 family protein [Sedimentisphaerales bacterium]|nr:DUF6141 family protein [Sedimentisphaerales bacterium]